MRQVSRRSFLSGTALTAGAAALPLPSSAKAPAPKTQGPGVYRYNLGHYQLTALFDGIWYLSIDDKFVRNASGAEVNQALAAAFLPPSVLPISFTALMVNTGAKLVLPLARSLIRPAACSITSKSPALIRRRSSSHISTPISLWS